MPTQKAPEVTLYTRPGCHLCEEAKAAMAPVLREFGTVLREIPVLGARPSNLCFGGPDGRTVYVTEVEHRRLVQFRVDEPGLAWQRWKG